MNNIYGIDTNHHHPVTDWFKVKSYLASKNLSTAQLVPVWSDGRSRLLKDSGNIVSGFPGS